MKDFVPWIFFNLINSEKYPLQSKTVNPGSLAVMSVNAPNAVIPNFTIIPAVTATAQTVRLF